MSKLEIYLSKIIKYGLYAILLTPLAFWPKALFPFLTPKFILFQILVEIVFATWLILRLLKSDFGKLLKSDFNNWLTIALSFFIAVSFISAIFGIDFSRSFWGIGPRMTGLFAELHFLIWFLVLVSFSSKSDFGASLKSDFSWQKYLNFSFFVALVVAATAFYQNPKWGLSLGYGIFNNPTFVAPYLIFHFFWGLYQAFAGSLCNSNLRIHSNSTNNIRSVRMPFIDWDYYKRWFFGAGATFLFAMILFAQIRGAVLGLLVGIFAIGIGLIFSNILSRRARIILSTVYIFLIVSIAGLWYLRDNSTIQKFSPIKRVTGISLQETTIQTRILAWQVALKGFKDQVLFGAGPENFNYLFNKHYDPKFLKFGGGGFGETWFDKPHNAFLEVPAETGLIGGLAYIIIWLAAVFSLFRLFKSGQKLLTIILSSAFIAYLGAAFFSFDSFGSWFGLFLMLGFLASRDNTKPPLNLPLIKGEKRGGIYLFGVIGLLLFFGLFYLNYSIWRANLADADALRAFYRNPSSGLILFDKSFGRFSPYKDEYQLDMISSVAAAIQNNIKLPNWEEVVNYMIEKADEALSAHPNNAAYYTDMVKIYNILGVLGRDPKILAQAESFGKKSLELSPGRQETLFYLVQTALLKGDTKTAVILAKQAVDLEPTVRQSHWYFGLAYIADKQIDKGSAEIKKALELGYGPQNKKEADFIKSLGLGEQDSK